MIDFRTDICDRLGLRWPIFGFSHSIDVTVALARIGCYPIYGAAWDIPEVMVEKTRRTRDAIGDLPFGASPGLPA